MNSKFTNELEKGSDINIRERDTYATALVTACSKGDVPMVELLLQFQPDVNIPERSSSTPLHIAASQGDLTLVQLLLGTISKSLSLIIR